MKGMVLSMKLRVVMTNGINYLIESGEFKDKDLMSALVNYSPLIEVGASWSIYPTVQVYPS